VASCSPVTELAGRGEDTASGAGRLAAGSNKSSEPDGSGALGLPDSGGYLSPSPVVVLRIPADTVVLFLVQSTSTNSGGREKAASWREP
jgi:hypothetical protein